MAYENPEATPHPQSDLYEAAFREGTNRLLRTLVFTFRSPELAEDALQGAYLKSFANGGFDEEVGAPIGYWLSLESKRVAIDMLRSNSSRTSRELSHGSMWSETVEHETPESAYLDRERAVSLHAAIRQLPSVQQRVILLELEGYSQSEIANLCNAPLGTTKTRMRDAKIRLRSLLSDFEDEAA